MKLGIIWQFEYVLTLLCATLAITFHIEKKKHGWLYFFLSFLVFEGIWLLRNIPGFPEQIMALFYFIIFLCLVAALFLSLDVNWMQAIFLATASLSLQHLSYKLTLIISTIIGIEVRDTDYYFLIELFVLLLTSFLAYFFFGRKLKDKEIKISSTLTLAISFIMVFASIIISFYTQQVIFDHLHDEVFASVLIHLLSVIVCLATLTILYQDVVTNSLKEENQIMQLMFQKDKERYNLAKITSERIRIKYHDLKHEMSQRELDEEEMKDFKETETNYQSLMFSGSKALDLILMEKQFLASKENCHITALVDGEAIAFIKSYQIYSMMGNLLDNAIEAAKEMPNEEERIIKVEISKIRDNSLISVTNHMMKAPEMKNSMPLTTKKDKENHGYGLKSIKSVVDQYRGIMNIKTANNVFEVKILFPYVEKPASKPNQEGK